MASTDLLIQNVQIVDGTGNEPFTGNVAIKDGKIAAVGDFDGTADKIWPCVCNI